MVKTIKIIGGGLAGTEAAFQLAQAIELHDLPYKVELWEMRPKVKTPAHHTDNLAELVCSNSLGSEFLTTARGVLIAEMEKFDSLIISAAKKAKVPAGQALAVDRDVFAREVTAAIENHPRIEIIREEFQEDLCETEDYVVIASGPLTSPHLAENIQRLLASSLRGKAEAIQTGLPRRDCVASRNDGVAFLHFFDAASPILTAESVDMNIAFKASRYDKGVEEGTEGDYINCPFYDEEEFENFYQALISAERAPLKDFEKQSIKYFEGCMPIEAIAERGKQTMCFGPLKPVGLIDPRNPERKAVAVVQLRQDNVVGSLYNIVGFQTNLKWGEQKRVFSMIPGLKDLEIVRYGVMHQNIFINSPKLLNADMSLRTGSLRRVSDTPQDDDSKIYFAGQITGVEGYTESAATGIIAARSIIQSISNRPSAVDYRLLPQETMMGALAHYISHADAKHFQPINSNWGLINTEPEKLDKKYRKNKRLRQEFLAQRALSLIDDLTALPFKDNFATVG